MSNHTPEPWQVHHDIDADEWPMIMAGGVVAGKIVANVNIKSFYCVDDCFVEMPYAANARRIVACVNACRGLSTDELEQHGLVSAVGTELAELEQQRDELLAALKEVTICAEGAMEQANADGAGWDIEFTLREANRLIAMTKGGESCSTTPTMP